MEEVNNSQASSAELNTETPNNPKFKLSIKFIFIIGGLLFLILVSAVFYYLSTIKPGSKTDNTNKVANQITSIVSPTPETPLSQTDDWQIFKTATFQIKLPPGYIASEIADDQFMINTGKEAMGMSSIVISGPLSERAVTYIEMLNSVLKMSNIQQKPLRNGVEIISPDENMPKSAFIKYNDMAIILTLVTDGSDKDISEKFDLIIATFESRDKDPEYCIADQEYTSDSYHPLSCRCPENLKLTEVSVKQNKCPDQMGDCPIRTRKCIQ